MRDAIDAEMDAILKRNEAITKGVFARARERRRLNMINAEDEPVGVTVSEAKAMIAPCQSYEQSAMTYSCDWLGRDPLEIYGGTIYGVRVVWASEE